MEPRIQYAKTSDGVSIAYTVFGSGPLLITTPSSWESLNFVLDDAIGGGFYSRLAQTLQVVRYDRRSTGLSDSSGGPPSLDTDVADIAAVADAFAPDSFVLMGGFHLGPGAVAYTARHPQRVSKLVLYSTFARGHDLTDDDVKTSIISMVRSHWGIARRTLADLTAPGVSGEILERIASDEGHSASGETVAQFLELGYRVDITELLPQISVPTLVLHRRGDRAVPFRKGRELASRLSNARLVPLEGAIHWPWLGDSESVISSIEQFVSEGKPRGSSLPSGMTAILFADIADSTALTESLGDKVFREKARDVDSSLRAIIREHSGTCIDAKTLGDGVLATFTSAAKAIEAAMACGKAGEATGLLLHLGLHAGDVIREDNNVYGGAVNIAARICALSAPGEILVSDVVRGMARTSAAVQFGDRGEQEMKGVDEPVRVYVVTQRE